MSKLIEAKDLGKIYNDGGTETIALRDVSLQIAKGEFVAIMGPSGSGKSTLLHILGLLDKQTSGSYKFDGRSITEYSEEELAAARNKKVGFVFQAFNLIPRTTVSENVELPLVYSNVKEVEWPALTTAAIEAVGLTNRIHHESGQLSGGEKQRVAIARALVNQPEIIFADEPTGNLDTKAGAALMEIITKLNDEGCTIVVITHEKEIAAYAQRIIHVRDGRIEKDEKNK